MFKLMLFWRTNATFAISRYYACFDIYVEADTSEATKKIYSPKISHWEACNIFIRNFFMDYI